MHRLKHAVVFAVRREPKLFLFFCFNVLYIGIEASIQKERAEAVTLKNTTILRQTGMVGAWNVSVRIEVLKPKYKLETRA